MPNPFPGMDPFLENHWGDVHTSLTTYTRNQLQAQLPGDLRARVEENVSVEADDESRTAFKPDVRIVESSGRPVLGDGGVAVAEIVAADPILVSLEEELATHRAVLVVDRAGGRVVTSIEFLSPHNKLTARARQQFRRKQDLLLAAGVNLVEIDLVRQGGWALSFREPASRQTYSYPYKACAVRAVRPSFAECYVLSLRDRLPAIRIPLRPDDPDVLLDLQPLIDAARRDGAYDDPDPRRDPLPPFDPADVEWITVRLTEASHP